MPELHNRSGNLLVYISLLQTEGRDIAPGRPDYENWVGYTLVARVEDEVYEYPASRAAALSVYEIRELVSRLQQVAQLKAAGRPYEESFVRYEYLSSGGYFGLTVEDPLDPEEITIELWLAMGALTHGTHVGYDRGFRFEVSLTEFERFVGHLEAELRQVLREPPQLHNPS